jgi:hypothetical protein
MNRQAGFHWWCVKREKLKAMRLVNPISSSGRSSIANDVFTLVIGQEIWEQIWREIIEKTTLQNKTIDRRFKCHSSPSNFLTQMRAETFWYYSVEMREHSHQSRKTVTILHLSVHNSSIIPRKKRQRQSKRQNLCPNECSSLNLMHLISPKYYAR